MQTKLVLILFTYSVNFSLLIFHVAETGDQIVLNTNKFQVNEIQLHI